MSKLGISTGTLENDGTGDSLLQGGIKINSNFDEIYNSIGDGSNINIGVGKSIISTLLSSGNVGIGSTIPKSKLDVIGDGGFTGIVTAKQFDGQLISGVGTVTTFNSTNSTITNLTGTAGTITTFESTDSIITNGIITNSIITNLTGTASTITNLTGTVGTITTFESTDSIITNLTGTAGTITTFDSTSATITNLTGTAVTVTTFETTNSTITNLTGTAGTITTFESTDSIITNLTGTAATITNLTGTAATITNLTGTSFNFSELSTLTSGPLVIGSASSTGSLSQTLQITGGAYISNKTGIGTTSPTALLHISAGTTSISPFKLTAGDNLSAIESGSIEFDGTNFYATPNTNLGRASIPTRIYTSGIGSNGVNISTNYAIFSPSNDVITLPVGTYLVKARVRIAVTGSTVSSACSFNMRGDGNAVGSFSWGGIGAILDASSSSVFTVASTALGTPFSVTATSAANPRQYTFIGEGILRVTTQGTLIPSYSFGATLTSGTAALVADNYLIIDSLDTQSSATAGPLGSGWG